MGLAPWQLGILCVGVLVLFGWHRVPRAFQDLRDGLR